MSDYKQVGDLFFKKETPEEICNIISSAHVSRKRLRFHWGNSVTGEDWNEKYDTTGTVGRSTGTIKIPLLIKTKRSMGGGAIMDNSIVKIVDQKSKLVLFQHPSYH